jgi:hypothetical protein
MVVRSQAAARLLRPWVQFPPASWMSKLLSLIQKSPTECGASSSCDPEASCMRRSQPTGSCADRKPDSDLIFFLNVQKRGMCLLTELHNSYVNKIRYFAGR